MDIGISLLKAMIRLRYSEEGKDFVNYLEELSVENYKQLKYSNPAMRDILIGKAQAIDEIKDFILNADIKARIVVQNDPADWSL